MEIDFALAFVWFAAFLFSTTVHEAMHGLVAWKGGDPTAYDGGQVSLSPAPHVAREPIGMVVVPLLTAFTQGWVMGWASVPYDRMWAERYPRRAAAMAFAGPAGNFLIALGAFAAIRVGLGFEWLVAPDTVSYTRLVATADGASGFAVTALSVLLVLNVFLGLFNLLPVPPLDGFAILKVALPERYLDDIRHVESNGAMSMIGLVCAWQIFPVCTDPVFSMLLRLIHPSESYS